MSEKTISKSITNTLSSANIKLAKSESKKRGDLQNRVITFGTFDTRDFGGLDFGLGFSKLESKKWESKKTESKKGDFCVLDSSKLDSNKLDFCKLDSNKLKSSELSKSLLLKKYTITKTIPPPKQPKNPLKIALSKIASKIPIKKTLS
ncbi:hypothetical protein [Helicobacter sp. T3_23-1056]